mmetsp:Transcript_46003/g.118700  ORF Transcript_46003/g.118700 Transcript_46003/m.118700 type:complete len:90 (-) Transcript_46003:62-331(-)
MLHVTHRNVFVDLSVQVFKCSIHIFSLFLCVLRNYIGASVQTCNCSISCVVLSCYRVQNFLSVSLSFCVLCSVFFPLSFAFLSFLFSNF